MALAYLARLCAVCVRELFHAARSIGARHRAERRAAATCIRSAPLQRSEEGGTNLRRPRGVSARHGKANNGRRRATVRDGGTASA